MSDILGPVFAVALGSAELFAIWKWGVRGTFDRAVGLVHRIIDGPPKRALVLANQAEIARLESELGIK